MIKNIDKFSFAQMTSNSTGKTSSSGVMGCLICTTGCITFLIGSLLKHVEILSQSVLVITIGAGLLGYRKSKEGLEKVEPEKEETITNE
jgi:hypothetical protein